MFKTFRQFWKWFAAEDLDQYRDDINSKNFVMLRRFATVGIAIAVLNFISQLSTGAELSSITSLVQLLWFIALTVWSQLRARRGIPRHSTFLLYFFITTAMMFAILMGSVFDASHTAYTIVIYLTTFPLLILDKPWRLTLYLSVWPAVFLPFSFFSKVADLYYLDCVHILTGYLCALLAAMIMLGSRLEAIRSHHQLLEADRTDDLTGLYNRRYFIARSDETVKERKLEGRAQIIYYDFNGMRNFNRDFGFAAGDRLLQAFARLLQEVYPGRYTARFGEDHFVVMAYESEWRKQTPVLIRKANDYLMEHYGRHLASIENTESGADPVQFMIKAGICTVTGDVPVSLACDHARVACHSVHTGDAASYRIYDRDLEEQTENEQYVLENLDRAIREGYIHVYYQPVIRSMTETLCGAEALSRWIDPDKGFFSPAKFIPVLENHRLIYKLDLYVIEQVVRDFDTLKKRGITDLVPVSVNLSRNDFDGRDMVQQVSDLLDRYHCPHELIDIEITESAFSENPEKIQKVVDAFHKAGFRVWMDDFGSGYSSLNLLQDTNFDLIKLDMQFMKDFGPKNEMIICSLINMANRLGIDTLSEGVETAEQRRFLRDIGCERIQGFYYSKPLPLEEILKFSRDTAGFSTETAKRAPYYESLGRVDLAEPFAFFEETGVSRLGDTLPAAIAEWDGSSQKLQIVRVNGSFQVLTRRKMHLNADFDAIGAGRTEAIPIEPVMVTCLRECLRTKKWASIRYTYGNDVITSYAHYISTNPDTGAAAVLLVSIGTQEEAGI